MKLEYYEDEQEVTLFYYDTLSEENKLKVQSCCDNVTEGTGSLVFKNSYGLWFTTQEFEYIENAKRYPHRMTMCHGVIIVGLELNNNPDSMLIADKAKFCFIHTE